MTRALSAFAPASVGNFAAGFDILGAALAPLDGERWGDVVEIAPAANDRFDATGPYAGRLPPDPESNLVLRARRLLEARLERGLPCCAVTLHKNLPLGSGLGSSSASIVAALVAFNAWAGEPFARPALLGLAGAGEAIYSGAPHLDNVAPALLGGLRLVTPDGEARALPFPGELLLVVLHPEFELTTAASRAALPREIPVADAVRFAQNLAAFVHALHARDRVLLRRTLRDPLAEPHRGPLVPGFNAVQQAALGAGALGCSLSGSGPALFAVFASEREADAGRRAMLEALGAAAGLGGTARVCRIDPVGARLL